MFLCFLVTICNGQTEQQIEQSIEQTPERDAGINNIKIDGGTFSSEGFNGGDATYSRSNGYNTNAFYGIGSGLYGGALYSGGTLPSWYGTIGQYGGGAIGRGLYNGYGISGVGSGLYGSGLFGGVRLPNFAYGGGGLPVWSGVYGQYGGGRGLGFVGGNLGAIYGTGLGYRGLYGINGNQIYGALMAKVESE